MSLEAQIVDARRKADLFSRRLDEARRLESEGDNFAFEESTEGYAPMWGESLGQGSWELPLPVPVAHSNEGGPSVASLELLVKAQQRDLVKGDTDLRVCIARSRTLQQKADELERALQDKEEQLRMITASSQHSSLHERDSALHEAQMQALKSTEYARSLELRLDVSEARCKELSRRLAVAETRLRNSFDGGSGGNLYGAQFEDEFGPLRGSLSGAGGMFIPPGGLDHNNYNNNNHSLLVTSSIGSLSLRQSSDLRPPVPSASEPTVARNTASSTSTVATTSASATANQLPKKAKAKGVLRSSSSRNNAAASSSTQISLKASAAASGRPSSAPAAGGRAQVKTSPARAPKASHRAIEPKKVRSIKVVVPSSSGAATNSSKKSSSTRQIERQSLNLSIESSEFQTVVVEAPKQKHKRHP